jgi:hypothetical protein
MQNKLAYLNFPEETENLGVGEINRIIQKCGALKVPEVTKKIVEAELNRKTPLTLEQRHDIIKEFEKPRIENYDRGETISELKKENRRVWELLKAERLEHQKTITELQEQIEKLKIALKKYKEIAAGLSTT